jgi:cyanophycin synthetase
MTTHRVNVREVRALRQHNLYAYIPVLHIIIDIGAYEEQPSTAFPGFIDRLVRWLPGLKTHECSVGRPGGFIERLKRGTYLAHICEHVTLELQNVMGFNVTYGKSRGTGETGVYRIVLAYDEAIPAKAAFETALRLVLAAMHDEPFDIKAEIERLQEIADEHRLGPSTAAIVRAARRRWIPVIRLTPTSSLIQLGYGVYQKRIIASETSNTSAIAVELCQEKPLTNRMLSAVGVPVPEGRSVTSADEAWQAAQDIGLPVVIKPEAGNQGKGVSVNLKTEVEVREGCRIAQMFDDHVLVERHIEGDDYRLLIVNGEMCAAAKREPAQVTGDGQRTVEALVEEVNRDPRRRPGHSNPLTRIKLDGATDLVLSQQGMTRLSVPAAGQVVRLRHNSNLSTGGTATDVTDEVHPHNARLAELAAQILALDVAGIDMLCQDIRRPLAEQRGAIVEVNAAPGLRMHIHPTSGQSRNVGTPIVRMLYPDNRPTRIPIIAVTGTNGKTTVTRLIGHMYDTARWTVGMTSTDGTYIGKERIMEGDCSGPKSAQAILLHPRVEIAVLETARGGILREGLGYDSCTVGVVTNVSSDHLGQSGINTLEDLARVKQVVVEAVDSEGTAVLNADDPMVAEMAAATSSRVVYFSMDPSNPIVRAHLAEGNACVLVREGAIVFQEGQMSVDLIELDRVPFTAEGKIEFQVANALAATAAAWCSGLNPAMIARALTTFRSDTTMAPGRFNVVNINGVEVILDYGHNPAAVRALGQAIASLGPRRTVMVLGLPGDRRNEDILATFEETRPFVDEYILHDLIDRRERACNEVPEMMRSRLPADVFSEITVNQRDGIENAWKRVHAGDRLIVVADIVDDALDVIRSLANRSEADACPGPLAHNLMEKADDVHAYRTW